MPEEEVERDRFPYKNKKAERFLATRKFWEYVDERDKTRRPWEYDRLRPEQSIQDLNELRKISLSCITDLKFLSPPVLWYGNSRRDFHWGVDLVRGNFNPWKEFKRRSSQVWAAIFYPSCRRDYDFLLCTNRYSPVALTRILDVNFRKSNMLNSICGSLELQFEQSTEEPILLPKNPKSCTLDAVKDFVGQLDLFKGQVHCSIKELSGRFPTW